MNISWKKFSLEKTLVSVVSTKLKDHIYWIVERFEYIPVSQTEDMGNFPRIESLY